MARDIYGLDIGTSNIKIYYKGKDVFLNEKNIIAILNKTEIYAYGDEAFETDAHHAVGQPRHAGHGAFAPHVQPRGQQRRRHRVAAAGANALPVHEDLHRRALVRRNM